MGREPARRGDRPRLYAASPRADGGIGRRARLRAWSGITGWRFESSSAHRRRPCNSAFVAPAARRAASRAIARVGTHCPLRASPSDRSGSESSRGGYQALAGVHPDLTTMGKAIANGFPLAAIGGRREHLERFNTTSGGDVHFGGTYNGNAIAVEAGLATIEQLEDGRVHKHVYALGERMRTGLAEIAARVGVPAVVGGYGSLFVLCFMEGPLESYDDVVRNDEELFGRYRRELIERGVFEMPESLGRSHIGASHTAEDIDRSLEAAEESLRAAVDSLARAGRD